MRLINLLSTFILLLKVSVWKENNVSKMNYAQALTQLLTNGASYYTFLASLGSSLKERVGLDMLYLPSETNSLNY